MKLHAQNPYKGGEKASRNNPKCYSKQNQKEIQSWRQMSFSEKTLSLESAYLSVGILKNLINLLIIWSSGDVAIGRGFKSLQAHLSIHLDHFVLFYFLGISSLSS